MQIVGALGLYDNGNSCRITTSDERKAIFYFEHKQTETEKNKPPEHLGTI